MSDKKDIILVDFSPASGVRGVAKVPVDQLQEKSAEAIDKAMGTMRAMAAKVMDSVKQIKVSACAACCAAPSSARRAMSSSWRGWPSPPAPLPKGEGRGGMN